VILVVEDSPDDEALIVHALEDSRLGPITVTHDGAEALEYLRAVDETRPLPDVVLLDMNLPAVKGLDVLRGANSAACSWRRRRWPTSRATAVRARIPFTPR
jgi:CheY-like chemotaxis protein